jgi:hypothetical protein
VVDSSTAVADRVAAYLRSHPAVDRDLGRHRRFELLVSDVTDQTRRIAGSVLKRPVRLQQADTIF